MGRLTDIKNETSPFLNKEVAATKRLVFTITDILEVSPRDENDKGYWKVTVKLEESGEEKFFSLGHGKRDLFMLTLQDSIASEGPLTGCILTLTQVGIYKVYNIEEV